MNSPPDGKHDLHAARTAVLFAGVLAFIVALLIALSMFIWPFVVLRICAAAVSLLSFICSAYWFWQYRHLGDVVTVSGPETSVPLDHEE